MYGSSRMLTRALSFVGDTLQSMSGPHAQVREAAGRTLGLLLYAAVERQKQQHTGDAPRKVPASKDIMWTLQSATAYLAFLYNKSK